MFGKLKKLLFKAATQPSPASVCDPVLGELKRSVEGEWWEAEVEVGGSHVGFNIGGEPKPNEGLLATAHQILNRWPDFEGEVTTFLASEIGANEFFAPYAAEIQQLVIDDICLFWPERPDDGMIYFSGGEGDRVWRCDYVNAKPQNLGFDD